MSFSLTILGCSSALPTPERFPTAQALNVSEHFYLIDCGEGTQIQLRRNKIKFGKISHIFISHLHGDHYFGLFGLISTFVLLGRKNDLHIYCHQELKNIFAFVTKYFIDEISFKIIFHFLNYQQGELIFENDKLTIESFPLKHKVPTCGFLFKEKTKLRNIKKELVDSLKIPIKEIRKIKEGHDFITKEGKILKNQYLTIPPPRPRSYAFCSDTAYYEEIIPTIENVDLLYHEATFMNDMENSAAITSHSTTIQAAAIAKKANVKKLVIGHYSLRYKDLQPVLDEARSVFNNTIGAEDGLRIEI